MGVKEGYYPVRSAVMASISQWLGYGMDAYDMTLVIALTPILNKVFLPAAISPFLASTITLLGYALTLLFRPIGSALFGHFGDRIGRRDTLLITLGGIGAASALTAALPTYAQVGLVAYGLFAMLRAILGIFAGGEYAAGHPFAMEQVTLGGEGYSLVGFRAVGLLAVALLGWLCLRLKAG